MTIVVKPAGRGNWKAETMVFSGGRAAPFTVRVGDKFRLGGITWRVCAISA